MAVLSFAATIPLAISAAFAVDRHLHNKEMKRISNIVTTCLATASLGVGIAGAIVAYKGYKKEYT